MLGTEEAPLEELARTPLVLGDERAGADTPVPVGPVARVPGIAGGWYQLAVDIGLVALPASVLGGCLASWIWRALTTSDGARAASGDASGGERSTATLRIVLQEGERSATVELEGSDRAALADALAAAARHVDPDR